MRIVADCIQRLNEWRWRFRAPMDRQTLGREIDAGSLNARYGGDNILDLFDAGAAMNAGDRQIGLTQSTFDLTTGEKQLLLCVAAMVGVRRCSKRDARCAAAHDAAPTFCIGMGGVFAVS